MNNQSKEIRTGAILSYIASIVAIIASLLFNPIIINNLGKSEYGLYETIGSFVNYLSILDLGFSSVVVRYVAKYEAEKNTIKRNEFLYVARRIYQILCGIILVLGVIMYCFLDSLFGKSFTSEELRKAHILFFIVLCTTCVSIYGQVYSGALSGIERFIVPGVIRIVKIILSKAVAVIIVLLGAGSIGYTIVLLSFELLSLLVNKFYSLRVVSFCRCRIVFSEIKELLVFTSYLLLQAIASQMYWQIDKVVLGAMIGTEIVAVYSIALTQQNIVQNISGSIKGLLLPKATRLSISTEQQDAILPFMIRTGRIILISYMLLYIGLVSFGKEFINLWLGQDYEDAYLVFVIIGFSAILPTVLGAGETVCRAYNRHQFLSKVTFITAIINLGLTILWVKCFGYIGAACATATGLIIGSTIIPLFYYKKIFPFSISGFLLGIFSKDIICFCIALGVGFACNRAFPGYSWITLVFKSFIVGMVYLGTLYAFGFSKYEKDLFKSIFIQRIQKMFGGNKGLNE